MLVKGTVRNVLDISAFSQYSLSLVWNLVEFTWKVENRSVPMGICTGFRRNMISVSAQFVFKASSDPND